MVVTLDWPVRMVLGYHEHWVPPNTTDSTTEDVIAPVRAELGQVAPRVDLLEVGYLGGTKIID
jgi:hypothetical protein